MKFKSKETEELNVVKQELLSLQQSIEVQLGLAKLALESAEKSLQSLFSLWDEDNCQS